MNMKILKKAPKSVAAGPYLGYSLQPVRLCFHLLKAPDGEFVSLEYVEDIAVHRADGTLLLEQSKSAISANNPVSDTSLDLWKTFANWADLCVQDIVDPDTTDFRLYVTPVKSGEIVRTLDKAKSEDELNNVLLQLKNIIKSKKSNTKWKQKLSCFLEAGDKICSKIISRFEFVTEKDPIESILELTRVLPTKTPDDFCAAAIGFAQNPINKLMRDGKSPILATSIFRKSFHAFVRKYDFSNILQSKAPPPSSGKVSTTVDANPLFVQQLRIIDAQNDMLVTAVSDYLRTTADKVSWADEGLVVESSFDELDTDLERQHKIIRDEIEDIQAAQSEEQRGRTIYRKCTTQPSPSLEGQQLPSHFISGAFNCLADTRRLGWHPNYQTLLPDN